MGSNETWIYTLKNFSETQLILFLQNFQISYNKGRMVLLSRNLQCLLMCLSIPLPTCQPFFASPLSEVVLMWCYLWGKKNFDLGWHDVHSQQLYDVWGPKLSQTCIWGTSAEGTVTEGDKCRKESERKREKGTENETLNKYWERI